MKMNDNYTAKLVCRELVVDRIRDNIPLAEKEKDLIAKWYVFDLQNDVKDIVTVGNSLVLVATMSGKRGKIKMEKRMYGTKESIQQRKIMYYENND